MQKVKVVLISQTGAEGLDLKFIRQVHILEPWYNMSRIEQIVGRAVRTCSHKALPFVQRNVELYLYGTLNISMDDANLEETADLYLYRLAEIKAIQIGKVSRVLKEVSIDCILNKGQMNFSEENMSANQVKAVTLSLSSGGKLEDYKIGDKPFSSMCDYMESCSYTCKPDKEINDDDVRLDTYNEDFIVMNNDKLIYKIKQLLKERFFYKKSELVTLLNIVKPYPLVQINAALHQLTEDKNEYVTDKYGRLGNLINIDDLYLFQPLELKNQRSSIHDRSIPLEVKHDKIVVKVPKEVKLNEAIINIKDIPAEIQSIEVLRKMIETNYQIAITLQKIVKGEKNWYMFCHMAIELLKKSGLSEAILHSFIAEHIFDELPLTEVVLILNNYETNPIYNTVAVFKYIKAYINKQILLGKRGIKGFLWKNNGKIIMMVKEQATAVPQVTAVPQSTAVPQATAQTAVQDPWHIAEAEDMKDLEERLNEKKTDILSNLNSIIGFMNNFKMENYVVFKTKDINNPRDLGARCDQNSSKSKAIEILNSIVGLDTYSTNLDVPQREICVLQEFYLRLFERERKDRKHWFLSPPEAVLTNIEKFTTTVKTKPNKKQTKK